MRTAIREPRLYLPIPDAFAEKCAHLTYREIRKYRISKCIPTERYGSGAWRLPAFIPRQSATCSGPERAPNIKSRVDH